MPSFQRASSLAILALCYYYCLCEALPNHPINDPPIIINHLRNRHPDSLRNDYSVLRHGQSLANVAKLIASSPEIATQKYGLSDLGKEQASRAGEEVRLTFLERNKTRSHNNENNNKPLKGVLLLASDLLRAKETALIVQRKLQEAGIPLYHDESLGIENGFVIETRMRERWFGDWDETSDKNYENVWKDDAVDPDHTLQGVESVNQVMKRTTKCIQEWDEKVEDCLIVCVAHGDVLQILQTAFAKMDGSKHRTLEHLETAKLRCLELASTTSS